MCACLYVYAQDDVGFGVEGLAVFSFEETNGGCPIFLHLESGACAVLARSLRELARARVVWLKMVFGQSHHADTLRWLIRL